MMIRPVYRPLYAGLVHRPTELSGISGAPFVTAVLLHFDGAQGTNVYTNSGSVAVTMMESGTNRHETTAKKFGTASLYLPSGFIGWNDVAALEPGADNFCVDMWFRNAAGAAGALIRKGADADSDFELRVSGSNLLATGKNQAGIQIFNFSTTDQPLPTNDSLFHHVALTREGSTFRIFVDGVLKASQTSVPDAIRNSATGWSVGKTTGGIAGLNGCFIDELRHITGAAGYVQNFTPPASAYPDP